MFTALAAVGTFIHDMNGFCERNPQSCDTGKSFFGLMAEKAQQGAAFAYQWVGESLYKGAENTEKHITERELEDIIRQETEGAENTEQSQIMRITEQKTESAASKHNKRIKPAPHEKNGNIRRR